MAASVGLQHPSEVAQPTIPRQGQSKHAMEETIRLDTGRARSMSLHMAVRHRQFVHRETSCWIELRPRGKQERRRCETTYDSNRICDHHAISAPACHNPRYHNRLHNSIHPSENFLRLNLGHEKDISRLLKEGANVFEAQLFEHGDVLFKRSLLVSFLFLVLSIFQDYPLQRNFPSRIGRRPSLIIDRCEALLTLHACSACRGDNFIPALLLVEV